ncbi:uncharacterized protein LOC135925383 isoform X2 [Gordionus sp. m RMFG-2023]|uniref:uncharacterized protein LOC135925383 isoform X2 n=1 Tax=Gordionus sp. m RMFG-2023 TaxID=3053472 RepID=UPI0031FE1796
MSIIAFYSSNHLQSPQLQKKFKTYSAALDINTKRYELNKNPNFNIDLLNKNMHPVYASLSMPSTQYNSKKNDSNQIYLSIFSIMIFGLIIFIAFSTIFCQSNDGKDFNITNATHLDEILDRQNLRILTKHLLYIFENYQCLDYLELFQQTSTKLPSDFNSNTIDVPDKHAPRKNGWFNKDESILPPNFDTSKSADYMGGRKNEVRKGGNIRDDMSSKLLLNDLKNLEQLLVQYKMNKNGLGPQSSIRLDNLLLKLNKNLNFALPRKLEKKDYLPSNYSSESEDYYHHSHVNHELGVDKKYL